MKPPRTPAGKDVWDLAPQDLVCAPRPVGVMGVDGKPVVLAHLQTSELATSSLVSDVEVVHQRKDDEQFSCL